MVRILPYGSRMPALRGDVRTSGNSHSRTFSFPVPGDVCCRPRVRPRGSRFSVTELLLRRGLVCPQIQHVAEIGWCVPGVTNIRELSFPDFFLPGTGGCLLPATSSTPSALVFRLPNCCHEQKLVCLQSLPGGMVCPQIQHGVAPESCPGSLVVCPRIQRHS